MLMYCFRNCGTGESLRQHWWRAALLVLFIATSRVTAAGTGVPDTQLWTEVDVNGHVSGSTTIGGVGQLRLSESLPNPTLTLLGIYLNYERGDWTFGAEYRHQVTGNRQGEEVNVSQVARLNATWKHSFGRSTIAIRSRLEDTLTSADAWRARLRAEYRWATNDSRWSYVFANDEVFYQFSGSEFFRNRFQAGLNVVLGTRSSMRVYYQRQDSKEQTPGAINALGLALDISLD